MAARVAGQAEGSPSTVWGLLLKYLRPQAPRVLVLALLLLGGIGLQLLSPQILRAFIDAAKAREAMAVLTGTAGVFVVVLVLQQATRVGGSYVSEKVGWHSTNALREDLVRHCLSLDLSFHNARTPGALIERVDGDVLQLARFLSDFAIRLLGSLLLVVGVLVMLFLEGRTLGLAFTAYAILTFGALYLIRNVAIPAMMAAREADAELFGVLEEQLAGTEDIRASGAVPFAMRRFHSSARNRARAARRDARKNLVSSNTWTALHVLGSILALVVSYQMHSAGSISLGTVILILAYTDQLINPLRELSRHVEELQRATASGRRIRELLDTRSRIPDGTDAVLVDAAAEVEFREVTFAYGEGEPALRDVSFRLPPGRVLGVLGRTGSGKTTLNRLLFRYHDPTSGTILMGGSDTTRLRLANLRGAIGLVSQNVQLFHASIRDNLTFFDRQVADDRLLEAIRAAGLEDWLRTKPQGLDTVLESGGANLSAGESQLLAFARVFLASPSIVVLDEATSRLDPATERSVESTLDALLAGRTGIVIAHRLTTLRRADDILILEGGQVVELGPRRELEADRESRFAGLLRTGLEEVLQ